MKEDDQASKDVSSRILYIFLSEGHARMKEELVKAEEADLIEGYEKHQNSIPINRQGQK